jgi:seryl-tRNA synthetase
MTLAEFEKLKTRVEDAQRIADRAAGAAAQLKKRLADEYGCDGLKAAKRKLKELERAVAELETEFETALAAFENENPESPTRPGE